MPTDQMALGAASIHALPLGLQKGCLGTGEEPRGIRLEALLARPPLPPPGQAGGPPGTALPRPLPRQPFWSLSSTRLLRSLPLGRASERSGLAAPGRLSPFWQGRSFGGGVSAGRGACERDPLPALLPGRAEGLRCRQQAGDGPRRMEASLVSCSSAASPAFLPSFAPPLGTPWPARKVRMSPPPSSSPLGVLPPPHRPRLGCGPPRRTDSWREEALLPGKKRSSRSGGSCPPASSRSPGAPELPAWEGGEGRGSFPALLEAAAAWAGARGGGVSRRRGWKGQPGRWSRQGRLLPAAPCPEPTTLSASNSF